MINENYFSVIIPLYNKEEYIKKAINSVLNQKYRNFELIIVNDGSVDKSLEIAQSFTDTRITIVNKKNGGASRARNTGIEKARYDYITFLDADDIYLENRLEILNSLINQFSKEVFFSTNYYTYSRKNLKIATTKIKTTTFIRDFFGLAIKNPLIHTNTVCVHKRVFNEISAFDPALTPAEDSDLWVRLAAKYPLVYSPTPTSIYYPDIQSSAMWNAVRDSYDSHDLLITTLITKWLKVLRNYEPKDSVRLYIESWVIRSAKDELSHKKNRLARLELKKNKSYILSPIRYYYLIILTLLPFREFKQLKHSIKSIIKR